MIAKLLLLSIMVLVLAISLDNNGKERKHTNAWHSLIAVVLNLTLLYFSGFFVNF